MKEKIEALDSLNPTSSDKSIQQTALNRNCDCSLNPTSSDKSIQGVSRGLIPYEFKSH